MALYSVAEPSNTHSTCRYGSSRLTFRGPPRPLDGRHIAFVGGSETFAKNIAHPYPMLIEHEVDEVCINFGQFNASVETFLLDPLVGNACRDAMLTVVSLTGAANLSNRLYSVHPRRNDRFLRPSNLLRAIYPEVDFTEICFTRHLLNRLQQVSPDRFRVVREELQAAWLARMRTFIELIGPDVLLLWFSAQLLSSGDLETDSHLNAVGPLFVSERMVNTLRPLARDLVIVPPIATSNRDSGLDEEAHQRVAVALLPPIQKVLLANRQRAQKTSY